MTRTPRVGDVGASYVDVRRVLTKTPLARQHEGRLDGKATRRPKPIPRAHGQRRARARGKGRLEAPWRKEASLEDIDEAVLHVAALSETISCALIAACLERATDATTRTLFANLVSDEVHHARFGWYYLSWRSPQWTRAERQRLADSMASNVVMIERRFWRGRDAPPSAAGAARALGVLESEGQRAAVRAVMESEIVPVLDSLGLGASHAWRLRERGP